MDHQEITATTKLLTLYQLNRITQELQLILDNQPTRGYHFTEGGQKIIAEAKKLSDNQLEQLIADFQNIFDKRLALGQSKYATMSYLKHIVPCTNKQGFKIIEYSLYSNHRLKLQCSPDTYEQVYTLYDGYEQLATHRQHKDQKDQEWMKKFTPIIQEFFKNTNNN